jgi:hypothetical protein
MFFFNRPRLSIRRCSTSYEQPKPNRKVLEMLDGVFGEIELRILREWPSKRAMLNEKGIA